MIAKNTKLKDHTVYGDAQIRHDRPIEQRNLDANMRIIADVIGHGRLIRPAGDRDGATKHNGNNINNNDQNNSGPYQGQRNNGVGTVVKTNTVNHLTIEDAHNR